MAVSLRHLQATMGAPPSPPSRSRHPPRRAIKHRGRRAPAYHLHLWAHLVAPCQHHGRDSPSSSVGPPGRASSAPRSRLAFVVCGPLRPASSNRVEAGTSGVRRARWLGEVEVGAEEKEGGREGAGPRRRQLHPVLRRGERRLIFAFWFTQDAKWVTCLSLLLECVSFG